ncbi:hypothetical protein [Streptomyces flavidovirens]|uniref:hypothetical protein n=1 Tax=Streptomyces flavidovirens TaxID=67298 RepID=UPI0003F75013|nr:hypothetical protein [Streptomyces flavidovirens]
MTIDLTAPAMPDSSLTRRMNYMTALALAETILSESTVIPTNFTIQCPDFAPDEPSIQFYFHQDPAAVAVFADEQSMTVDTRTHGSGDQFTEASGELVRGVKVTAWALVSAVEAADAAEVSA